jgi:hypothetical protein
VGCRVSHQLIEPSIWISDGIITLPALLHGCLKTLKLFPEALSFVKQRDKNWF